MKPRAWWLPARAAALLLLLGAARVPVARAAQPVAGSTLDVYAAASLADVFKELADSLEARLPGLKVRLNLGGSNQLASQLVQGGHADVFASADTVWMGYVSSRGLLARSAQSFARNRMVVIVPATNPARIIRLQDLARGGVKVLLCAEAVPAGHYSRKLLGRLGSTPGFGAGFTAKVLRNVVSEEENVRAVVAKIQLGEADAGIVYRSDVSAKLRRYLTVIEVPDDANVLADYPIAVLKDARAPADARSFVDLVLSAQGQQVLARHGFLPPAPGGR